MQLLHLREAGWLACREVAERRQLGSQLAEDWEAAGSERLPHHRSLRRVRALERRG